MDHGEAPTTSTQSRLEAAMLAGEVAWWEMDVETGHVEFHESKAEMLGYDPDRFDHYEDFTELVHPEDHERAMEAMRAHLEGRAEKYDVEYRIKAADGSYRWFHDVGGIGTRSEDGSPKQVAGLVIDITGRKTAAAAAEIRNEQLALLNRIIRHDIANDMTVVRGNAELIEDEVSDDVRPRLERIKSAAAHVMELTDSVEAALEAIEDDEVAEGEAIELEPVLRSQVEMVDTMFEAAEIAIDGEIPEVSVIASPLLDSVVSNVIENAIEHNDTDQPLIEVGVEAGAETVTIRIADNGPGIDDETKAKVFELGETRSPSGSGMGLFIASTLVEAFGGSIEIEDNDPRGAVFVLTLKRA